MAIREVPVLAETDLRKTSDSVEWKGRIHNRSLARQRCTVLAVFVDDHGQEVARDTQSAWVDPGESVVIQGDCFLGERCAAVHELLASLE